MNFSELVHDRDQQQFVLCVDGEKAFIDYVFSDGEYRLVHSEVPFALRGRGVGRRLVEETFAAITDEGCRAVAVCSYIRIVARRSEKWRDVIAH
jgi:predicted GNAT family acetyltransferase